MCSVMYRETLQSKFGGKFKILNSTWIHRPIQGARFKIKLDFSVCFEFTCACACAFECVHRARKNHIYGNQSNAVMGVCVCWRHVIKPSAH